MIPRNKGKILFKGFTTGDIKTTEKISDYKLIRITYTSGTTSDSRSDLHTLFYSPEIDGNYIFLNIIQNGVAGAGLRITFATKAYTINKDTFIAGRSLNFDLYENSSISMSDIKRCNIIEIIGYNKKGE